MIESEFIRQAKQAIAFSREGMDHLIEVHELQQALKNKTRDNDYAAVVREIIEKEKLAVGLIQKSTLIQRDLMRSQEKAIQDLIDTL
jgi:RNA polymerase-interacting CarD/CdnL/TRCF family regulator